jgi:hypothetical protein
MRILLASLAMLLLGGGPCLAQMSTMGTTQMALPTTPGAIVSSPLGGPGPFVSLFSPSTVPGAPATTLASPPLATDPTIPGTSLSCSPTTVALSPSVMSVTATTTPSASTTMSPIGAPAIPGSSVTSMSSSLMPTTPTTSQPLTLPPAMPVMILGAVGGSTTGTIAPAPPLGTASPGSTCTAAPGNALTNSAASPLAISDVPPSPPPGSIPSPVDNLASTDIEPAMTVIPTPNSAACNENVSFNLANPAMMAPANATGASATPGVMPQGC